VEEQYKFVFAIAIQYTNPFKYVTCVMFQSNFGVYQYSVLGVLFMSGRHTRLCYLWIYNVDDFLWCLLFKACEDL